MIQEVVCRFSNCCCARSWKMKSVQSSPPPALSELTHARFFRALPYYWLHLNCICHTHTPSFPLQLTDKKLGKDLHYAGVSSA